MFGRFTCCVGALIAAHRRLRDEQVAGPPLRLARAQVRKPALYRRVGLVAASVVLLVALIAVGFGVRTRKLRAVTQGIMDTQSFLQGAEPLEEEVGILQRESDRHRSALDLLLALSEALPKGVLMGDLNIDSAGNVTIVGRAPSVEVASKAASALAGTGKFAEARLWRASKEKEGVIFRITCVVR